MESARPTLRTLTDDLRLPLPPIDELLEEIDHPLLAKARAKFSMPHATHERIRAIDDEVVWKVKVQRWRGAVWTADQIAWLIAAGNREEGPPDDFYEALASQAPAAPARYNAEHPTPSGTKTFIRPLPP